MTTHTEAAEGTVFSFRAVIVRWRPRSAFDTFPCGGVKHRGFFDVFGSPWLTVVGVNRKFHLICEEKCPWLKAHGPRPDWLNAPDENSESSSNISRVVAVSVGSLGGVVEKQLSSIVARARW